MNKDLNIGLWVMVLICLMSSLALLKVHTELPNWIVWLSVFYWLINFILEASKKEEKCEKD